MLFQYLHYNQQIADDLICGARDQPECHSMRKEPATPNAILVIRSKITVDVSEQALHSAAPQKDEEN